MAPGVRTMMSDKAPYVVTFILGVLGWLVSHMVDRIVETPTLEYHVEEIDDGGRRGMIVELINVTRNKSFAGLEARIVFEDARQYGKATLTTAQPAFEGTTPPTTVGGTTTFTLPPMLPGSEAAFGVSAISMRKPSLRISSTEATPIRLQQRGLETFFARNEIAILLGLFILWLLALVALAASALRTKSTGSQAPTPAAAGSDQRHIVEIRVFSAPEEGTVTQMKVERPGDSPPSAKI